MWRRSTSSIIPLRSVGNPSPTYSLVSGPDTMTVDPLTGLATWIPTVNEVGETTATFRATNSIGQSEITVPITVRPDVPVLSYRINPDSGERFVLANQLFTARISDASLTTSTFELVSAPVGMTIDRDTGTLQWMPSIDDAGNQAVTVRATNDAGQTEIAFSFNTYFVGEASNISVTGLTELHPTVTWSTPLGEGSSRIAGYTLTAFARYRYGRAWRSERIEFDSPGNDTSGFTLEGLTSGRKYKLSIHAYDGSGGLGLTNTQTIEFASRPAIPSVGWKVTHADGISAVVAAEPMLLQLTNGRPEQVTYELMDAPEGFEFDPAIGTGRWTPSASAVGEHNVRVRATNSIGRTGCQCEASRSVQRSGYWRDSSSNGAVRGRELAAAG